MQVCVSLQNCKNARILKERADTEVYDLIKVAIYNQIKKLSCGNPIDETVCCEKEDVSGKIGESSFITNKGCTAMLMKMAPIVNKHYWNEVYLTSQNLILNCS